MNRVILSGVVAAGLLAGVGQAATIYVNGETGNDNWTGFCEVWDGGTCGPKRTIQAGIDVADPGDTVQVADGTYTGEGNKNLDFGGRAITVRSENGPETCIIDCEGQGRGFYFHSSETAESVVGGFTIRNGYAAGIPGECGDYGGGILCHDGGIAVGRHDEDRVSLAHVEHNDLQPPLPRSVRDGRHGR